MFCSNCGCKVNENENFCPTCGAKVTESNNNSVEVETNMVSSENLSPVSSKNKPNAVGNKKKIVFIFCIIVFLMIVGIIFFFTFHKEEENIQLVEDNQNNKEEIENVKEETKQYNTYEKLKQDFDNKKIDTNEYFTQLVYYMYNSSKLNSKYKSDYDYYTTGCQNDISKILEEHKEEINSDILRFYLENVSLHNVALGDENKVQTQSSISQKSMLKPLGKSNDDLSNVANHRLNRVKLSKNGHFLIWYADVGNDAITEQQLEDISSGLEMVLSKFQTQFNIQYSYDRYQDAIFNEDYKNAKEVLKTNNISMDVLETAMSVYVYDTGSDDVLAAYMNPNGAYVILDLMVQMGLIDDDGIVQFPYIIINRRGFSNENESLKQLYAHELFHHFQYLFCSSTTKERCISGTYGEGMANFASALVSDVSTTNNFLNTWSSIYTRNVETRLSDITDGASYGYGTFPYLYMYSRVVKNWNDVLMNAHTQSDAYPYIQAGTSKDDLIKISDSLVYNVMANGFDNKSLYSPKSFVIREKIDDSKVINDTINPGAIVYYEVSGKHKVEAVSENKDYVGVRLYGYKSGTYTELVSSYDKIDVDLTYYAKYDKFYLAVNNANLTTTYSYKIMVNDVKVAENSDFVTTFDNYSIKIETNISMSGVSTNSVSVGTVDERHQKQYLDVTTATMGVSLNNKMYHDFNTGYTYLTQPYGGDVWWKEKSASQMVDLGKILNKLTTMKNVTKVSENHYKVKMSKDEVSGVLASSNTNASSINGDIYVEVYTKDGYITKLDYDFTKIVQGVTSFKVTITCSNYNQAGDVEIPQSIIDNAKVQ